MLIISIRGMSTKSRGEGDRTRTHLILFSLEWAHFGLRTGLPLAVSSAIPVMQGPTTVRTTSTILPEVPLGCFPLFLSLYSPPQPALPLYALWSSIITNGSLESEKRKANVYGIPCLQRYSDPFHVTLTVLTLR